MRGAGCAAALLAACTSSGGVGTPTPPTPTPSATTPPPVESREVVVAVKGDWGAGTAAQRAVTERMCSVRRNHAFADVITTGDNFYAPDGTATRRTYRDPESCLLEDPDHRWRASWGNHDALGTDTLDVLGAERWYRWSEGDVDFFTLDSNRVGDDEQQEWLRSELRRSDAAVKIVSFHHPPYTVASTHRPHQEIQRRWVPLFIRHGVTLVLSGHAHVYEHHIADGIHYVVTGGGGAFLHRCEREAVTLLLCEAAYHFLLVRIQEARVVVRAIRPDGSTLDRIVIDRQERGSP